MDRREFFKRGFSRATKKAVEVVDNKMEVRASRWIRPPFAIAELEFLLACSRCDACSKACSYSIIFPLAASNGADVMNTPALDLLNKGCHLCDGWPCVTACESNALCIPDDRNDVDDKNIHNLPPPLPKLASVSINPDSCLPYQGPECGACASACSIEGALQWDAERPSINDELCTGCAMCREACITEPKSIRISKNHA